MLHSSHRGEKVEHNFFAYFNSEQISNKMKYRLEGVLEEANHPSSSESPLPELEAATKMGRKIT